MFLAIPAVLAWMMSGAGAATIGGAMIGASASMLLMSALIEDDVAKIEAAEGAERQRLLADMHAQIDARVAHMKAQDEVRRAREHANLQRLLADRNTSPDVKATLHTMLRALDR